jgi:hypothetical protein
MSWPFPQVKDFGPELQQIEKTIEPQISPISQIGKNGICVLLRRIGGSQ